MYTCYIQSLRILASFCSWAGWFESYLVKNLRRHIFAWWGSNVLTLVFHSLLLILSLTWTVYHSPLPEIHWNKWMAKAMNTPLVITAQHTRSTKQQKSNNISAAAWQNQQNGMCAQQTQISLISSESSLCAQWVANDPILLHAHSKDWSESLLVHRSFCWFCHVMAHFS